MKRVLYLGTGFLIAKLFFCKSRIETVKESNNYRESLSALLSREGYGDTIVKLEQIPDHEIEVIYKVFFMYGGPEANVPSELLIKYTLINRKYLLFT